MPSKFKLRHYPKSNIGADFVKGAGESGTVGALPAVMNAINDALAGIGAPYVQMPATPEKVWRAMQAGRRGRMAKQ